MIRSILPSATLVLSALVAATAAHAAGPDAALRQGQAPAQLAMSGPLKLQKTYFETAQPSQGLAPGFNVVGTTQTVNCAVTAGCTILVNANTQLQATASANPSAICVKIDGSYVNCPYNTAIPADGSYTVMNYQTGAAVAMGSHTVAIEVYTSQSTTLYRYNTEVKLYR